MRIKWISRFLMLFCSTFLLAGCGEGGKKKGSPVVVEELDTLVQVGDLVFRRGSGLVSRVVTTVDPRDGGFSHIGIIVQQKGIWKVVHAVPGEPDFKGDPDRVKMETLNSFFDPKRAVAGAVMRVGDADQKVRDRAMRKAIALFEAGTLFDHAYDRNDTTEMYCTELIDFLYLREGVDLTQGRSTTVMVPGFNGAYLLPSDIQQSDRLWMIYQF